LHLYDDVKTQADISSIRQKIRAIQEEAKRIKRSSASTSSRANVQQSPNAEIVSISERPAFPATPLSNASSPASIGTVSRVFLSFFFTRPRFPPLPL